MPEIATLGKILIVVGISIVVLGIIVLLAPRVPWLGRLPGDILVRRDGVIIYIPIFTCLILSILLTIIANVVVRLIR